MNYSTARNIIRVWLQDGRVEAAVEMQHLATTQSRLSWASDNGSAQHGVEECIATYWLLLQCSQLLIKH